MDVSRKYYRIRHKIEFYLRVNEVTDFSKFQFSIEPTADNNFTLNIERWDYPKVPKPDLAMLNKYKTNLGFIKDRRRNLLLHKEEFIIKLTFEAGSYPKGMILYDKFKDLSYVWFVTCDPSISPLIDTKDDSTLTLSKDINLPSATTDYIKCILIPKKDITFYKENCLNFSPAEPIKQSNRGDISILKPRPRRHADTGEPVLDDPLVTQPTSKPEPMLQKALSFHKDDPVRENTLQVQQHIQLVPEIQLTSSIQDEITKLYKNNQPVIEKANSEYDKRWAKSEG